METRWKGMRNVLAVVAATAMLAAGCSESPTNRGPGQDRTSITEDAAEEAAEGATSGDAEANAGLAAATSTLPSFSKRRAMTIVRKLANDFGVRVRTTRGETRAARYIAARFRDLGYEVKMQRFSVDGGKSRNVIARWPTAVPAPFVIGAHMDTVAGSPGANDNASGVAVILEMARIYAGRYRARFIQFVAFGSEEYGSNGRHHIGSEVMVNRMSDRRLKRTPGMLSVDMIADGRPLIAGHSGFSSDFVARDIYRKLRKRDFDMTFRVLCDCSDHGPFERAGVPAAFLWSGDEPNYHDPSDIPRNLVVKDLSRTGRAVRAYLRTFTRALMERYRRH